MSATTPDGVASGIGSGSGPVPVTVESPDDLAEALGAAGLGTGVPVLVVVGGAGGMAQADLDAAQVLARDQLLPLLAARSGVVVDGGTDSGVMAALGRARGECGLDVPLIGVAARGTVTLAPTADDAGSNQPDSDDDRASVEPHHSHIVLVPGQEWGDESPWIAEVATALADGAPSMTLVLNGGKITFDDVAHSLEARRPVLVLAGTGRTADEIASAATDPDGEHHPRAAEPAASPLVHVASLDDPSAVRSAVADLLDSAG